MNARQSPGARGHAPRRRMRNLAVVLGVLAAGGIAAIVATDGSASRSHGSVNAASGGSSPTPQAGPHAFSHGVSGTSQRYGVGVMVLHLVDNSRTAALPGGPAPRTLTTIVRYPSSISAGSEQTNAPPVSGEAPFPLVIFGHGFAVTPALYAPLLKAWAEAGYVVAAPVFPLENANAPGGPTEADLANQPADMSFVITRVLEMSAGTGPLSGLVDPTQIAVSGQSDGGDTALAVAYNSRFRDPRVKAAVVLSGAELPGVEGWEFQPGEPPLLATQGTSDTVNPPELTNTFFSAAATPKFLLELFGAEHLPPYSRPGTDLGVVKAVTIAFLDDYLKGDPNGLTRMRKAGQRAGVASLTAYP